MKSKKYAVLGLGNALMDIQVRVDDAFLNALGFLKGTMHFIDEDKRASVLEALSKRPKNLASGGSAANTLSALAKLGSKSAMIGSVGSDPFGEKYKKDLKTIGVEFISPAQNGSTGTCIVLITEDAQRTLLTTLGCAPHLANIHLDEQAISESEILYVEGYLWDTPQTIEIVKKAMTRAKNSGTRIAFSASDAFCVKRHLKDFKDILKHWAEIFFANAEEAQALAGESDLERTKKQLASQADYVMITEASKGSNIFYQGQWHFIAAFPVKAVDSTGAGDSYAAGILHGISQGQSIEEMGKQASHIASVVVSRMGARY